MVPSLEAFVDELEKIASTRYEKEIARAALHWYIGDGSLTKSNPSILLCTDNFNRASIMRLHRELRRAGFEPMEAKSQKGHRRVRLGVDDVEKFLAWVGPCPVPELRHKWEPKFRSRRNKQFSRKELRDVFRLWRRGRSVRSIAEKLNRPYHTIYSILVKRKNARGSRA